MFKVVTWLLDKINLVTNVFATFAFKVLISYWSDLILSNYYIFTLSIKKNDYQKFLYELILLKSRVCKSSQNVVQHSAI